MTQTISTIVDRMRPITEKVAVYMTQTISTIVDIIITSHDLMPSI